MASTQHCCQQEPPLLRQRGLLQVCPETKSAVTREKSIRKITWGWKGLAYQHRAHGRGYPLGLRGG